MCIDSCPQNVLLAVIGVIEIIAAGLGAVALSVNELLSTEITGEMFANVTNPVTNATITLECGEWDVECQLKLDQFYFKADSDIPEICEDFLNCTELGLDEDCTSDDFYKYSRAEDEFCSNNNDSTSCKAAEYLASVSDAYISMATIATTILFSTGVFLLVFAALRHWCCHIENDKDEEEMKTTENKCVKCCSTFVTEIAVMIVNFICACLFFIGFLLALLLQFTSSDRIDELIESSLNDLYNSNQAYIIWDVQSFNDGTSVPAMATAFVLCYVIFSWMACSVCCTSVCTTLKAMCKCCKCICPCLCKDEDEDWRRSTVDNSMHSPASMNSPGHRTQMQMTTQIRTVDGEVITAKPVSPAHSPRNNPVMFGGGAEGQAEPGAATTTTAVHSSSSPRGQVVASSPRFV